MAYISTATRQQVIDRARRRCEYCQTQQDIVIHMGIDHIIPQALDGSDDPANLCLACPTCNTSKSDFITGIDHETQKEVALFNPRQQVWIEHFQWSEDKAEVVGKTPIGRATVERLKMNLPDVVRARRRWIAVGWHPPTD